METSYKVKNNLFVLMAKKDIRALTTLSKAAKVNYRKLHNFATNQQKFIDPDFLGAICNTLDCEIGELITLEKEEKK